MAKHIGIQPDSRPPFVKIDFMSAVAHRIVEIRVKAEMKTRNRIMYQRMLLYI